jgi:Domain of unknown function (DUF6431)
LAGADSGALPSLPVIVFIPRSGEECKPEQAQSEWLPRQCPACGQMTIIGHGRRRRQAHDGMHDWILVRRGICKVCRGTLTVLPGRCVPGAPYSLLARQQALGQLAQGASAEQAAPDCLSPDRIADPSTIRRWFWRRIESLRFLAWATTLLAWDWRAASRILIAEPISP